uniref:Integrase catalytic domain-containing protein n=1 Tax=Trichogramma kaykai TaxID=54128 RepID=A0ABD2W6V8_9HYME
MINSKNTNDQYKKRQKFQGNCRSYGKRGHKQRDCWNKEEKQQSSFKENKHSGDGNALTGSLLTSRCDSTTQGDSKNWLLDSCTSHHMTNKRKWFSKMHRLPFPSNERSTTAVGLDSIGNSKYFLLFKDDYSSYVLLYFLKYKSEVKNCFVNYLQRFEKETKQKINTLRTDNGLEFVNKDLGDILYKNGIKHQRKCAHTPKQNGKAERENRTLDEAARTMLFAKNLPKSLWAEAVNTAAYVLNRSRKTNVLNKMPFELWHEYKALINHFKVFGCDVYTYVHKVLRKKWDAKSKLGKFIGYDDNTKSVRVLSSDGKKIEIYRDIIFKDELEINAQLQENCNIDNFAFYKIDFNLIELENIEICPANEIAENLNEPMNINNENENNENVNVIQENENGLNEMENDVLIENKNENLDQFEHVNYEPRYNLRNHRNLEPPNRGDTVTTFLFDSEEIDAIFLPFSGAPRTYNEAIKSERNSRLQQHLPMIIPNVQQVESPIPSCPKESQFAQCSANQSQSSSKTESISVECGIEAAKSLPTKKAVPNLLPTAAVENTSMTSVATPVPAPIPPCSSELIPEKPNESPNIVEATPVPAPIPPCSNQMIHERENESPNIVPTSENFQKNQLVWAYYSKKWDYLPGIISRIEKKINKNTKMMRVTKIFVKYFEPPTGKKLKSWPHEPKKIKNLTADSIVEERQKRSTDHRLESYLKEMLKNSTTKATINFDIRIKNALNVL